MKMINAFFKNGTYGGTFGTFLKNDTLILTS